MRLQDLTSGPAATRAGLLIGRCLPHPVGRALASFIATVIAGLKPEMYWTVCANLSHIAGPEVSASTLHHMTRRVFRCAVQCHYDFFHAVGWPLKRLIRLIQIPEEFFDHIAASASRGQGLLILMTHHSNFDLAALMIGARGVPVQVLTLPDPGPGFKLMNELRSTGGMRLTPISPETLRAAVHRLAAGGAVITGIDRPMSGDRQMVEFFGQPAELPVGPVRLALIAKAAVLMVSCYYGTDGAYHLKLSGPFEMLHTGDRKRAVEVNTARVIATLEEHVRAYPDQWLMFHPVWPAGSVPGSHAQKA
jgi:phosphatidylinositol dimannoside acyltransferase